MKPKRNDDKYWTGTRNFNHIQYESDLEEYIIDLENEFHHLRKNAAVGQSEQLVCHCVNDVGTFKLEDGAECCCACEKKTECTLSLTAGEHLFTALQDVCGFTALPSDMDEILRAVEQDN